MQTFLKNLNFVVKSLRKANGLAEAEYWQENNSRVFYFFYRYVIMPAMLDQFITEKLSKVFEANNVVLAYVFGSYARGNVGPLSDFDVAIVFDKEVLKEEYFKKELHLAHEIGNVVKKDRIDVINLITAKSPSLKYNAVFKSVLIFIKDTKLRFKIQQQIMKEYEDTNYLRETSYRLLRRRIKNGTFGAAKYYVTGR